MGLNISRVLAASTAHISKETAEKLNNEAFPVVAYDKNGYGWFILCVGFDDWKKYIPEDLFQLMKFAEANGCDWLNLDGACPIIEGLKTYDWS